RIRRPARDARDFMDVLRFDGAARRGDATAEDTRRGPSVPAGAPWGERRVTTADFGPPRVRIERPRLGATGTTKPGRSSPGFAFGRSRGLPGGRLPDRGPIL